MPDIYARIAELEPLVLDQLAHVLELRAADAQQQRMRDHYFAHIAFPPGARVLEIGCGTGAVTRALADWTGVMEVVGVDPSPALLERAHQLSADRPQISFRTGDARALPFPAESFDVVVFHTTLCHISEPLEALTEAYRVLIPGGTLAVFDANYADTTLATDSADPLQMCAVAAVNIIAFDPSLISHLGALAKSAGFKGRRSYRYMYDGATAPEYMLTIVDRGADALHHTGLVGKELSEALKIEARRRVEAGKFFGQITYASFIAHKPRGTGATKPSANAAHSPAGKEALAE